MARLHVSADDRQRGLRLDGDAVKQARQDWLDHQYARAIRGLLRREWPIIAFVIAFTVLGYTIVQIRGVAEDTTEIAAQLQQDLIEACEDSRIPLRDYFQGEIAATRATDPTLFPDIPPEVFSQLLEIKLHRLRGVVEVLDPTDCADQYNN